MATGRFPEGRVIGERVIGDRGPGGGIFTRARARARARNRIGLSRTWRILREMYLPHAKDAKVREEASEFGFSSFLDLTSLTQKGGGSLQDPRPKTQDPRPKTQDPRPKTQDPRPQFPNSPLPGDIACNMIRLLCCQG